MSRLGCCIRVIDLGTQTHTRSQKIASTREMVLGWELIPSDGNTTTNPVFVYKCYELSMAPESSLRKDTERLLGYQINADTHKRFGPKALLGRYCQLIMRKQPVDDIGSAFSVLRIKSLPSDLDQADLPKPITPYGFFMTSEPDMEQLSSLPPEIQDMIRQSIEFSWAINNQTDYDE